MATSADIYNQMQEVLRQYNQYAPTNVQDINNALMARVGNFAPQMQELRNAEARTFAYPAEALANYYSQYGASPNDRPAAATTLQNMLSQIGMQQGTTNTMRDILNAQGANINSLASNIFDQYNQMRDALMNRYQMLLPAYQAEKSAETTAAANRVQSFPSYEALTGAGGVTRQTTPASWSGAASNLGGQVQGISASSTPGFFQGTRTLAQPTQSSAGLSGLASPLLSGLGLVKQTAIPGSVLPTTYNLNNQAGFYKTTRIPGLI